MSTSQKEIWQTSQGKIKFSVVQKNISISYLKPSDKKTGHLHVEESQCSYIKFNNRKSNLVEFLPKSLTQACINLGPRKIM